MLLPGNTSPCHRSLHLFAKRRESQHTGIAQQLSGRALSKGPVLHSSGPQGWMRLWAPAPMTLILHPLHSRADFMAVSDCQVKLGTTR
ncbi:hypothetical protein F1640_13615 [Novosphingobium sp. NBM11]|nr:hypothetical protein [Novosphingobium sp. NBM11]